MKRTRLTGPMVVWTALAVAACSDAGAGLSYEEQVLADRAGKDSFFREDPTSPIAAAERATFRNLSYFPPNPDYRVPASLDTSTADAGQVITLPTSTGKKRQMTRVGRLQFMLKGRPLQLTAFVAADDIRMERLFVPFGDLTSGTETYTGGRYLDLDRTATGLYDLDFNRAYHPYCVYNWSYDCPFPPPENRLPIPVRAGERLSPHSVAAVPNPGRP